MAERSRSHTTWYSNLLLLPNQILTNQIAESENVGIRSLQCKLRYYACYLSLKKAQILKIKYLGSPETLVRNLLKKCLELKLL